jgi:membrane protein implicated in regulation of membrane protease activity
MPGYSLKLLPILALSAVAFGLVYVYVGVNAIILGAPGWGAAITLFGIAGVALGVIFWRFSRRRRAPFSPPGETPGPR